MIEHYPSDDLLRKYILGELSEEETQQIEQLLFQVPGLPQTISALRAEMLDDWTTETLSEPERQALERRLAVLPALRQQAILALQWNQTAPPVATPLPAVPPPQPLPAPAPQSFFSFEWNWHWGWAAATVLVLSFFGWVTQRALQPASSNTEIAQLSPAPTTTPVSATVTPPTNLPETAVAAASPTRAASPQGQNSGASLATFLLSAQLTRAETTLPEIRVPATAQSVQLQLELPLDLTGPFSVEWKTAEGKVLWEKADLAAHQVQDTSLVKLTLPASRFTASQANRLRLRAADPAQPPVEYLFDIVR